MLEPIDCLKKSGLSVKGIKHYMNLAIKGGETIEEHLELFKNQRKKVMEQMAQLKNTLDILDYKCRYCETAKYEYRRYSETLAQRKKTPANRNVVTDLSGSAFSA